jgi:intracellular sulfur oxidation DsrE/DsrF family protein
MKKLLYILFSLVLISHSADVFAQKKSTKQSFKQHLIIMQLTSADPLVHKSLVKQISNLKNGWKDTVAIEVVCHGPGLEFLMKEKTTYSAEIEKLRGMGIQFMVCENTMREKNISREAILPNLEYVMMGLAEIVLKQEQGWSYIKAGF